MGYIDPGPKDLSEPYLIAFNGIKVDSNSLFKAMLESCIQGRYTDFEVHLALLFTRQVVKRTNFSVPHIIPQF